MNESINRFATLGVLLLAAIFAVVATAEAEAASGLERSLGAGVEAERDPLTGALSFVGTRPGKPISGEGETPRQIARAITDDLASPLGIAGKRSELRPLEVARGGPTTTVRLAQEVGGLPVIGGEVAVSLDRDGDVLSVAGETTPDPAIDTSPRISADAADDAAFDDVARNYDLDPGSLERDAAELSVYDPSLLGGPDAAEDPRVVWRFEVSSSERSDIRQFVAVDASSGEVALSFSQIHTALDRDVCDGGNVKDAEYPCEDPVREDNGIENFAAKDDSPASTQPGDVNAAFDFAGDTYEFYADNHGRDSLDDNGMTIVSTADYCEGSSCTGSTYDNAFWDGEQMAYGDGFAMADDVVGHELTHGVTDFSSRLFYYYQSGAINESLSDIFGEFIDLTNGVGGDAPADRWLIGEDLPPSVGVLRDMSNPPSFGDPDSMTSDDYYDRSGDSGGVHINSGVGNKAAYLMTDGDTHNGRVVAGIGIVKTAKVFYEAQTSLLTTGSDYRDLHNALIQGCSNLVGTDGISALDCDQVEAAVEATEMTIDPPGGTVVSAAEASCPIGGETLLTSFFDDMENPANGNWQRININGENGWVYDEPPVQTYVHSGERSLYAPVLTGSGDWGNDYAMGLRSPEAVPPGSTLRFDHAYDFPTGSGGVVEASIDGGVSWLDLGPNLADSGDYTSTISDPDNPLQAREAFSDDSKGYGASAADLSDLGDQTARFRFRIGTRTSGGSGIGWVVDDVLVYSCIVTTDLTSGPDARSTISDATPEFSATNSSAAGGGFEVSIDGSPFVPATAGPSPDDITVGPIADGPHTVRIRALSSSGGADPTPVSRTFTVDTIVSDADATAKKRQLQKNERVKVKLKVGAQERVEVVGSGKVKVGSRSYKLKPKAKTLGPGEAKVLRLKPVNVRAGKRIFRALKNRKLVRAPVRADFADAAGNELVEKRVIRLKRKK